MEDLSNSASAGPKLSTLSFTPQNNQICYPHLPPGLYIFVQDNASKETFLMLSQSGNGHPFVANRVNKEQQREMDDFSWIGSAGEIMIGFGGVILGRSFRTGYFHKKLRLTESKSGDAVLTPCSSQDGLPRDLCYSVKEWEDRVLPSKSRAMLFRTSGAFQRATPTQLTAIQRHLQLHDAALDYSNRIYRLFLNIIESIKQITLIESRKLPGLKNKSTLFYPTVEVGSEQVVPRNRLVY